MTFFLVCILSPPLLVQRCNGTAAGLGYLEAGWFVHAQFLLGQ
jgi:hypothetical protein